MILLALAIALQAAAPALPPLLAPAAEGKLQCFTPNAERKTCASLASYRPAANGVIDNPAVAALAGTPFAMEATTRMRVENGRLCGPMTSDDVRRSRILRDGQPESEAQQAQVKAMLLDLMAPTLNKDLCMTFQPEGSGFLAVTYLDGVRTQPMDQRFIWVSPGDGYRVAP